MRRVPSRSALACAAALAACSASSSPNEQHGGGGTGGAIGDGCDSCLLGQYVPCNPDGTPGTPIPCDAACTPGVGCSDCTPGSTVCVGNEVHDCDAEGNVGDLVETCDAAAGLACGNGGCTTACEAAAEQPSNVGCEFWAVDLDQLDALNDPASQPWGVVLSNAGQTQANVTIELNEAPPGQPVKTKVVKQVSVPAGQLETVALPTRELDCGAKPNDPAAPGTCLSSNAFRITSSAPIVVYQFNVFINAFSNDASLLLPTEALGKVHRVLGWQAGHPVDLLGFSSRSYVTVVGVADGTKVRVRPTWRVRGNPPIPMTNTGDLVEATLGPFDVLNLETDNATFAELMQPGAADFTGSVVDSSKPVAVFSGSELTAAPGSVEIPTHPGWTEEETCCLDHLEEQLFPLESVGKRFVITRSPVRSTGSWKEPDVLRFVGAAAPATVTTTLPPPHDSFSIQPGETVDTWADEDVIVTSTEPVLVGQLLISQEYVEGTYVGDPAMTIFPPAEQHRSEYVILTPPSWTENWVVIAAEVGTTVTIDGQTPTGCIVQSAGMLEGQEYESRHCPLTEGVHRLSGDASYGIVAYGYGSAGSYAFAGGANVKKIYEPPPVL